jgi:hypothetical protein
MVKFAQAEAACLLLKKNPTGHIRTRQDTRGQGREREFLNLKKTAWLYIFASAVLLLLLSMTRGAVFAAIIPLALFFAASGVSGSRTLKKLVPSLFIVILYLFAGVSSDLFWTSMRGFSNFLLLFVFLTVMVLFYMLDGGDKQALNTILTYRKTGAAEFAAKTAGAAAAGVMAYFAMDHHIYVLSIILYSACFVLLLSVLKLEKVSCQAGGQVLSGNTPAEHGWNNEKTAALFSLGVIILLGIRIYDSIIGNKSMEPVLYSVMAAFFFRHVRMFPGNPAEPGNRQSKILDAVLMMLFCCAALYVNTKDINLIPPGAYKDDMYHYMQTLIASSSKQVPLFYESMPILAASLPYWLIVKIFGFLNIGITIISIRFFYAVVGALSVIFVYLAAKEIFNRRTAVLSAFLHTFMLYQVIISRATEHFAATPFFTAGAVYFFIKAVKKGNPVCFILSGFMTAMGMYFYNAAKLVPFIFVLYIILAFVTDIKRSARVISSLKGFFLLILTAVITFFPVITYILSPGSKYLERVGGMNYVKMSGGTWEFIKYFPEQLAFTIRALFCDSGAFGISSLPSSDFLDPVSAVLLLTGISIILAAWKKPKNLFMIAWLAAGLSGIIFAYNHDRVYMQRAGAVMPALVMIMAMALDRLASAFENIMGRAGKAVVPVILAVALFPVAFTTVNKYFTVYKNDPAVKFFRNNLLQRAADCAGPDSGKNVFVSAGFLNPKAELITAMLPRLKYPEGYMDVSMIDFARIYNEEKRAVLILSEGFYDKFMPVYRRYFPGADIKVHWNYDSWIFTGPKQYKKLFGWKDPDYIVNYILDSKLFSGDTAKPQVAFVSCDIPYTDIETLYGFKADYYMSGNIVFSGKFKNGDAAAGVQCDTLALSGMLDAPVTGEYVFSVEGAALAGFKAAGFSAHNGRVKMLRGLNPVKITLEKISGPEIIISWFVPNSAKSEKLARGRVIYAEKSPGLSYKVSVGGKVLYETMDFSVNSRLYYNKVFSRTPEEITKPFYSRGEFSYDRVWEGFIKIPETGFYSFANKAANDSVLRLDGKTVFKRSQNKPIQAGEIFLEKGRHRFYAEQAYSITAPGDYSLFMFRKREWNGPAEITYDMFSAM